MDHVNENTTPARGSFRAGSEGTSHGAFGLISISPRTPDTARRHSSATDIRRLVEEARAEAPREPFPYFGRGDAFRPLDDVVEVETTDSSIIPSPPTFMVPRPPPNTSPYFDRQTSLGRAGSMDGEVPHRASLTPKESLCDRMSTFFQSTTSQPGMTTRNHSESDGSFRPSPHPPAAAKTSKALPCHPRNVVRLASSAKASPASTPKSNGFADLEASCLVFGNLDDTLHTTPTKPFGTRVALCFRMSPRLIDWLEESDSIVCEHSNLVSAARRKTKFIHDVASFFA